MASRIENLAARRGCIISRTGNMMQVIKKGVGTVFQSFNDNDIMEFLCSSPAFMTLGGVFNSCMETDRKVCAIKYGRLTTRP